LFLLFYLCLFSSAESPGEESLVTLISAMYDMGPDPATISTTELDPRLPAGFPIPESSELIGSVSRLKAGLTILSTGKRADRVFDHFVACLPETGWVLVWQSNREKRSYLGHWDHPRHGRVVINVYKNGSGSTLHLATHDFSAPDPEPEEPEIEMPEIPASPPGRRSGGGHGWHSSTIRYWDYRFDSEATSEELIRGWVRVLHENGWSIIDLKGQQSTAYASLRNVIGDHVYHCLLTVRSVLEGRHYISTFRLERLSEGAR